MSARDEEKVGEGRGEARRGEDQLFCSVIRRILFLVNAFGEDAFRGCCVAQAAGGQLLWQP